MLESRVFPNKFKQETTYPCLKKRINGGYVVLFSDCSSGIVIASDNLVLNNVETHSIGFYSNRWTEGYFEPFYGQIELIQK